MKTSLLICIVLAGGCVAEPDDGGLSQTQDPLTASNKLAANKLAANKLAANKLAANKLAANSLEVQGLMATDSGRDVMSYIVGCAMPTGQSLTLLDATTGTQYTYPGWIGLAPGWATRAPTVAERHWVTACLLARTNVYGTAVNISMRHDTNPLLTSSATERATYTKAEGAFYGDLFAAVPVIYACSNRSWTSITVGSFRACALSPDGVTTDCGFKYTGSCANVITCTDGIAPFGSCKAAGDATTYGEVITIFLTPTQQSGSTT